MSDVAIKVENISKLYQIGAKRSGSLRETLAHTFGRKSKEEIAAEEFWALKDVSFEIKRGEAVGIIGKNGAGKSTLLKVLSRITDPTKGRIEINGRVASLLEVGTGFHPELTGRENIFMNGTILGMTRREIKAKFDEIVDFSGVEKFIDTPVKHYSSGMYVRLAFAVAAHLEPEILIIDEVLAVGDAEFQKKCLGKMGEVAGQGRTVLFVSHNMAAVKQLCSKGVVLKNGYVVFEGDETKAVGFYQNFGNSESYFEHKGTLSDAPGNGNIKILKFELKPLQGSLISISSGLTFEVTFFNHKENINLDITFELKTIDDVAVFHHGICLSTKRDSKQGIYKVKGQLLPNLLNSGVFKFKLIFGEDSKHVLLIKEDFIQFEILNEMKGSNAHQLPGFLHFEIPYEVEFI